MVRPCKPLGTRLSFRFVPFPTGFGLALVVTLFVPGAYAHDSARPRSRPRPHGSCQNSPNLYPKGAAYRGLRHTSMLLANCPGLLKFRDFSLPISMWKYGFSEFANNI
jgi:hypothetical protein